VVEVTAMLLVLMAVPAAVVLEQVLEAMRVEQVRLDKEALEVLGQTQHQVMVPAAAVEQVLLVQMGLGLLAAVAALELQAP
jgi:hypothetical protein